MSFAAMIYRALVTAIITRLAAASSTSSPSDTKRFLFDSSDILKTHSVRFEGCQTFTKEDLEEIFEEQPITVAEARQAALPEQWVQHRAIVRLCRNAYEGETFNPSNTCEETCDDDNFYGEYAVNLGLYLLFVDEYQWQMRLKRLDCNEDGNCNEWYVDEVDQDCEFCAYPDLCSCDDDNYSPISDKELLLFLPQDNPYACHKIGSDTDDLYAGPVCSSDQVGIEIRIFTDKYCTVQANEEQHESSLGNETSNFQNYESTCLSCNDMDLDTANTRCGNLLSDSVIEIGSGLLGAIESETSNGNDGSAECALYTSSSGDLLCESAPLTLNYTSIDGSSVEVGSMIPVSSMTSCCDHSNPTFPPYTRTVYCGPVMGFCDIYEVQTRGCGNNDENATVTSSSFVHPPAKCLGSSSASRISANGAIFGTLSLFWITRFAWEMTIEW